MALIERFTPGGNLYPDGTSTFATIVQAFRRVAETRDTVDTGLRNSITTGDTNTLTSAKTYTDNAESRVKTYTDSAEQNANTYTDSAVGDLLTSAAATAQTKATTAETNAKTYADTQDTTTLDQAKAYTDTSFAATGPGGATDAQVDAAVERAVQGGRISIPVQVEPGIIEINTL